MSNENDRCFYPLTWDKLYGEVTPCYSHRGMHDLATLNHPFTEALQASKPVTVRMEALLEKWRTNADTWSMVDSELGDIVKHMANELEAALAATSEVVSGVPTASMEALNELRATHESYCADKAYPEGLLADAVDRYLFSLQATPAATEPVCEHNHTMREVTE